MNNNDVLQLNIDALKEAVSILGKFKDMNSGCMSLIDKIQNSFKSLLDVNINETKINECQLAIDTYEKKQKGVKMSQEAQENQKISIEKTVKETLDEILNENHLKEIVQKTLKEYLDKDFKEDIKEYIKKKVKEL